MKKRFFITSVLMTLVLLVAISTATFAWYSAGQANNTANAVTLNAQGATTGAIYIDLENHGTDAKLWKNKEINLQNADADVKQVIMAPTVKSLTTAKALTESMIYAEVESGDAIQDTTASLKPWTIKFYVFNAADVQQELTISVTDTDDNMYSSYAMFVSYKEDEVTKNAIVNSAINTVTVGEKNVVTKDTKAIGAKNDLENAIVVDGNTVVEFEVVIWFDGTEVTAKTVKESAAKFGVAVSAALIEEPTANPEA